MLDYQQLAAPAHHGGVLVAPNPKSCAKLARENAALLNSSIAKILGSTLGSWRAATRERLVTNPNQPVIVVGHQPDFIHPGVWAKNVVARRLAHALHGAAVNLIVDSDAPKRLSIRVPVTHEDRLIVREVRAGTLRPECAYEQIAAIPASEIETLRRQIHESLRDRFAGSLMASFLDGLAESPNTDWVSQITEGRRKVESEFNIDLQDLRIRDSWWSPLAAHLLLDPGGFARAYNDSIAEYRVQNKVRSPNRPIPVLVVEDDRVELPFWFYVADQSRRRVFVAADQDHVTLCAQSEPIVTFSRKQIETSEDVVELVRRESGWLLRPRALITTIWARLFLADLFIHGIGGAKYDHISDLIIARYFQLPAPEIACATATLYMDSRCEQSPDKSTHERQLRDATWNPQRHILSPSSPELESLLQQRLAAIQKTDELSRVRSADRAARRAAFQQIHRLNAEIHAFNPNLLDAPKAELERFRRESADRRIACDRECFFALHPRTSLELLLDALPDSSDFV